MADKRPYWLRYMEQRKANPDAIPTKKNYLENVYDGPAIQETPRNKTLGKIADTAKYVLPEWLSAAPEVLNEMSYGEMPYKGKGQTFNLDPRALDVADLLPFGAAAGMTKKVAKGIPEFLEHTLTKPNPKVGTRVESEFLGGLLEPKIITPEEFLNKSVIMIPYDNSSRNMAIHGVSGHSFKQPVVTHGGDQYAMDLEHILQGIGGASNESVVNKLQKRVKEASEENLQKGGSGDVLLATQRMGERRYGANQKTRKVNDPKDFSTQPKDVLLRILDNAERNKLNLKPEDIKEFDDMIRNSPVSRMRTDPTTGKKKAVTTRPFVDFPGIMTEEGRKMLDEDGGLRKAVMKEAASAKIQSKFKFNIEDIDQGLADPNSLNRNIGDIGNSFLLVKNGQLNPAASKNKSYDTNFMAQYVGGFGDQFNPFDSIFKPKADALRQLHGNKSSDLHNMMVGSLNRRDENFAQFMSEKDVEALNNYVKGLLSNK